MSSLNELLVKLDTLCREAQEYHHHGPMEGCSLCDERLSAFIEAYPKLQDLLEKTVTKVKNQTLKDAVKACSKKWADCQCGNYSPETIEDSILSLKK